jgi:hypothetical protein
MRGGFQKYVPGSGLGDVMRQELRLAMDPDELSDETDSDDEGGEDAQGGVPKPTMAQQHPTPWGCMIS